MKKVSTRIAHVEATVRKALAELGKIGEEYDSARTSFALGHLDRAASDLQQARIAAKARGL